MRSQLEANKIFGLRFLRPTQILVSNLNSVETKMISGLRFRDHNSDPVSMRDQEDFGLEGGFNIHYKIPCDWRPKNRDRN